MERASRFFKMYQGVLSIPDVSLNGRVLLSLILSFKENGKKAFMSNDWLARKLQVSSRSVGRYLKELEEKKLILREGTSGRNILPGENCPPVWTKMSADGGLNRPASEDKYDHILNNLNRKPKK